MSEAHIHAAYFPKIMSKIVRALAGRQWCLIGGRSVEVWSNPPQTPDVDVLVKMTDDDADRIIRRFERLGVGLVNIQEGLVHPNIFLRDEKLGVEVDVLGASQFELPFYYAIERAVKKTIQGVTFPVATPEDLLILKANAAMDVGRHRDKRERDIAAMRAVVSSVKNLDRDYIATVLNMSGWVDEYEFFLDEGVIDE